MVGLLFLALVILALVGLAVVGRYLGDREARKRRRERRPVEGRVGYGGRRAPYPVRSPEYVVSLIWRLPLALVAAALFGALASIVPPFVPIGIWAGLEGALVPGQTGPFWRWMDRNWVPYGQTKSHAQARALASGDPEAVCRQADTLYVFDEYESADQRAARVVWQAAVAREARLAEARRQVTERDRRRSEADRERARRTRARRERA